MTLASKASAAAGCMGYDVSSDDARATPFTRETDVEGVTSKAVAFAGKAPMLAAMSNAVTRAVPFDGEMERGACPRGTVTSASAAPRARATGDADEALGHGVSDSMRIVSNRGRATFAYDGGGAGGNMPANEESVSKAQAAWRTMLAVAV